MFWQVLIDVWITRCSQWYACYRQCRCHFVRISSYKEMKMKYIHKYNRTISLILFCSISLSQNTFLFFLKNIISYWILQPTFPRRGGGGGSCGTINNRFFYSKVPIGFRQVKISYIKFNLLFIWLRVFFIDKVI